jgi:pimeloyl-ACP methyl ester carboxylesterase
MDALGLEQAVLLGSSEGGMTCMHFAALNPDRVSALILFSSVAAAVSDDEYPWGWTPEVFATLLELIEGAWADPSGSAIVLINPSLALNRDALAWYARYFRLSASPTLVKTLMKATAELNIANLLPMIQAPTLVLHRTDETYLRVEGSRYIASKILGAKLVELLALTTTSGSRTPPPS